MTGQWPILLTAFGIVLTLATTFYTLTRQLIEQFDKRMAERNEQFDKRLNERDEKLIAKIDGLRGEMLAKFEGLQFQLGSLREEVRELKNQAAQHATLSREVGALATRVEQLERRAA